jgi:DNA adenine methylase
MQSKNSLVQPVLKWVGGKRQLINEIRKYVPKKYSTYYEPFLGGGAVLFNLEPKKAVINDFNSELINVYNVIKDDVENLIEDLKTHEKSSEYFYKIRALDRTDRYSNLSNLKKASRLIYLNKTCYNGLYRVNSAGQFNSPYGRYKNPNIVNEFVLRAVSNYLIENNIKILNVDFEESLKNIRKGSFVYFDPPYDPVSDSSNFTGYTLTGFNKDDQIRLKKVCDKLNKKGIKFLLSNSKTKFITDLYAEYRIETISANRNINSVADKRGEVDEVLIRNYK